MAAFRLLRAAVVTAVALLLLAWGLAGPAAGQSLVISEFMARNKTTLPDEDGEYSDWIEIYNPGGQAVNLEGWFLTDDPNDPNKWPFPERLIAPGEFLIVFASGKDKRNPAGELHTNFRLGESGDFLALWGGDNNPDRNFFGYPEQLTDSSYGIHMESDATRLVGRESPARYLVPLDDSLGNSWIDPDFDDGSWREGPLPIGYDRKLNPTYTDILGTDVEELLDGVNSSLYIRIPFQVEDPQAVDVLLLDILYDDGFAAFLNGVPVARANAPEELAWDSVAESTRPSNAGVERYPIAGAAEILRAGTNILAIQGLNRSTSNNDFIVDVELTAVDVKGIDVSKRLYFSEPTPGLPNGAGFPGIAETPQADPPSTGFTGTIEVAFKTEAPGAVIRFTTDGTEPTPESELYTEPLTLDASTILKVKNFADGLHPSRTAIYSYIQFDESMLDFSSNLPLVVCTTFGRGINSNCCDQFYVPGHIMIFTPGEDGRTRVTSEPHFADIAGFRRRGASTCGRPKFSFNVEIREDFRRETADQLDKTVQIFDWPPDSDYVMYAPYNFDRALMRNAIAYWMSRQVGWWAARTRFVECFFYTGRGAVTRGSYMGVYVFMEKNKRNPGRVDVERLTRADNEEPEVMGGYILRRDRSCPGEVTTSAGGYGGLVFVYPKQPTPQQRNWITNYINRAVASLSPQIGSDADSDLIDVTGWIDHHILNWYPKNVDAFRLSGYMHKTRFGKLVMGPVWDYDRTMGCADDDRARDPEGWDNLNVGDGGTRYFQSGGLGSWYSHLFNNQPPIANTPWNRAYRKRWRELRAGPLRTENILGQIDAWAAELSEAADRNFQRWPQVRPRFGSFQGEVNHLKNWLRRRAEWIDAQFIEPPEFVGINLGECPCEVEAGFTVELRAPEGEIYYTLDGSDPQGPGSRPSDTAVLYEGPITITQNTLVTARVRTPEGSWSQAVAVTFVTEFPTVAISELMYNPPRATAEEDPEGRFTSDRHMEFIELWNYGTEPVDLSTAEFTRGVTFSFADPEVKVRRLEPNQRLVIVGNLEAFSKRYDTRDILIAGEYGGSLSNAAETVTLVMGDLGIPLADFRYDDDWYPETDGGGHSLVAVNPRDRRGQNEASGWRPSVEPLGSPGRPEPDEEAGLQRPGDYSQDGRLGVDDAVNILFLLFRGGGRALPCGATLDDAGNLKLLDVDGTGKVDVTDAVALLNYLFLRGPAPALGTDCTPIPGCPDACTQ